MTKKIAPDKIHSFVAAEIAGGTPMHFSHWSASQVLRNMYRLVHSRRESGKPFFGHGSWEAYLLNQHGFELVKPAEKRRTRLPRARDKPFDYTTVKRS